MSDIQFWKPVYQLLKPDEPLMNDALWDFKFVVEKLLMEGLVDWFVCHLDQD